MPKPILYAALFAAVFAAGFGLGALAYRSGLHTLLRPQPVTYQEARRDMHRAFPANGRYVMLGDSITEYMDWRTAFPGAATVNLGIAGDTTAGVLQRLDTVTATGAETALLLIGINDLLMIGAAPAEVASRHAEILRRLAQAGMRVVAMSLFTGEPGMRDQVAQVNALVEKSCSPPNCTYVDLNTTMSEGGLLKPALTYDRTHLNAEGYRMLVARIKSFID